MGQGSNVATNCSVGCRCSSDSTLLWLWYRPAAAALIQFLAWKLPYATGAAPKRKNKQNLNLNSLKQKRKLTGFWNRKGQDITPGISRSKVQTTSPGPDFSLSILSNISSFSPALSWFFLMFQDDNSLTALPLPRKASFPGLQPQRQLALGFMMLRGRAPWYKEYAVGAQGGWAVGETHQHVMADVYLLLHTSLHLTFTIKQNRRG